VEEEEKESESVTRGESGGDNGKCQSIAILALFATGSSSFSLSIIFEHR
jgi:hypothetical protein